MVTAADWRWFATLLGAIGGAIVGGLGVYEALKPKLPPPRPPPQTSMQRAARSVKWDRKTGEPIGGTIYLNGGGDGH